MDSKPGLLTERYGSIWIQLKHVEFAWFHNGLVPMTERYGSIWIQLKHVEFAWFHYDFLLRCGGNRFSETHSPVLMDRAVQTDGLSPCRSCKANSHLRTAENQVKA